MIQRRSHILSCIRCALMLLIMACGPTSKAQQFLLRPAVVPNAAAQNALRQQIHKMLEPMLKAEISFANRAAKLNDEQRRALISAAVQWLDTFADEFLKKQNPNEQQMWLQGVQRVAIGGRQQGDALDPREEIQRGIAKLITETLPAEKAAAYEQEAGLREAFRRDAIVASLVDQLDEKLKLSPEQRAKIAAALTEHWDEQWAPQLESFTYARNYYLPVPEQYVRPELTTAQRGAFDLLNSSQQQVTFSVQALGGQGSEVIDDIDLNEKPADVAEPAAAAQPITGNADQAAGKHAHR